MAEFCFTDFRFFEWFRVELSCNKPLCTLSLTPDPVFVNNGGLDWKVQPWRGKMAQFCLTDFRFFEWFRVELSCNPFAL